MSGQYRETPPNPSNRTAPSRHSRNRSSVTPSSSRLSIYFSGGAPLDSQSGVSKSASSAAISTASDFKHFVSQAEDGDRRAPKTPSAKPNSGAAESLRRVTSSSTLNSIQARRPSPRSRKDSSLSIVSSTASTRRTIVSTSTPNPANSLLQQKAASGASSINATGKTADNKSYLTALGQAHQARASAKGKEVKSHSLPIPSAGPIRANSPPSRGSSLSNDSSAGSFDSSSSLGVARPRPSATPRRRPQSFTVKPPNEATDTTVRRLGPRPSTLYVPTEPSIEASTIIMAKRTLEEVDMSGSSTPVKRPQNVAGPSQAQEQSQYRANRAATPSFRRKTWFSFGGAEAPSDPSQTPAEDTKGSLVDARMDEEDETLPSDRRRTITPRTAKEQPMDLDVEEPPPPMNEEEAAFRASLDIPSIYTPSTLVQDTQGRRTTIMQKDAAQLEELTSSRSHNAQRAMKAARRVTWFGWKAEDENQDEPFKPEPIKEDEPVASNQQQEAAASSSAVLTQGGAVPPGDGNDKSGTVHIRTVKKRGWLGGQYEAEDLVDPQAQADGGDTIKVKQVEKTLGEQQQQPSTYSLRSLWNRGKLPDAVEVVLSKQETAEPSPPQQEAADENYPPVPSSSTSQNGQGAAASWRWSLWGGGGGGKSTNEKEANNEEETTVNPDSEVAIPAAEAMDVEKPTNAPSFADSSNSWTYSSYLSRWVPTWVYKAQQKELNAVGAAEAQKPEEAESPKTPAEQVKADALARDASPSSPTVDPNKVFLNQATKSSWISYFSSRSANRAKQLTGPPTDEDGLEVLDISDMEAPAATAKKTNDVKKGSMPSTPVTRSTSIIGGSDSPKPGSIANNESAATLSISKDGAKLLSKTALAKAANASAALSAGAGNGKKKETTAAPTNVATEVPAAEQVKNEGASLASNYVLPTFDDTFGRPPRSWAPRVGVLERTLSAVNSYLFSKAPDVEKMKRPTKFSTYTDPSEVGLIRSGFGGVQHLAGKAKATGKGSSKDKGHKEALKEVAETAQSLLRTWSTLGHHERAQTKGCAGLGKIVVIGVHGWFTQSIFKTVLGEPTGTSLKFATMQAESIRKHFASAGMELNPEAITVISLQGDGKVADRVDKLFSELLSRPNWVKDLGSADAIFLSAHSQGAIVATQLLARLIEQRQVRPERSRICLLAMCGIHHGPFAHLRGSITSSYINYFETAAAKELFDFQSSNAPVSAHYAAALQIVLDAGVKTVYVGSTDDNVVPLYSALNTSNSHPSILRALYIDGQVFPKIDFLTNLLVLCVAVRNAGLNDHNLLTLLSASVAGSLYGGTGHSKVYEEAAVYDLATRYLFEVAHPLSWAEDERSPLISEPFEAQRWNPYELPWALRGFFEDKGVRSLFAQDILGLLEDYEDWKLDPKSKSLKDLQWRLAPMRSIAKPKVEGEERKVSKL